MRKPTELRFLFYYCVATFGAMLLMAALHGCNEQTPYDHCDPFQVEKKICYEEICDGDCVRTAGLAVMQMANCPDITDLKYKDTRHIGRPGGHRCLTGKNKGKPFEVMCS